MKSSRPDSRNYSIPAVFIRADGSSEIGLGHIMRTGALAAALRHRGAAIRYLSRYPQFITGFETIEIPADISLADEPDWIQSRLARPAPCALIIDHYGFDQVALDRLAAIDGCVSLIIDDMNLYEYNSALVLNQNAYAPELEIRGSACPLLGTGFLLMREEFADLPAKTVKSPVTDILITMGAADPARLTLKLIEILPAYRDFADCKWHVVIGPAFAHADEIRHRAGSQEAFILHSNPASVKELMLFCDISICAAGSSTYELAACGVPSLLIVAAENQRLLAEKAAQLGWGCNLGDGASLCPDHLLKALAKMIESEEQRTEMARRGQAAIDGKGAARVADQLLGLIRRR